MHLGRPERWACMLDHSAGGVIDGLVGFTLPFFSLLTIQNRS
jgi:hypothetical protein